MKETDHQTQIKLSVRRQGGYSFKLSNRFTIGIPDLLIALPPFAPCLAEVKDLGECVADFSRKLDVSPKQAYELKAMNEPYKEWGPVGILLITLGLEGTGRILVPLPQGTERLTGLMVATSTHFGKRQRGADSAPPWYDMMEILAMGRIPKL